MDGKHQAKTNTTLVKRKRVVPIHPDVYAQLLSAPLFKVRFADGLTPRTKRIKITPSVSSFVINNNHDDGGGDNDDDEVLVCTPQQQPATATVLNDVLRADHEAKRIQTLVVSNDDDDDGALNAANATFGRCLQNNVKARQAARQWMRNVAVKGPHRFLEHCCLALIGPIGCGKSHLVRWCCVSYKIRYLAFECGDSDNHTHTKRALTKAETVTVARWNDVLSTDHNVPTLIHVQDAHLCSRALGAALWSTVQALFARSQLVNPVVFECDSDTAYRYSPAAATSKSSSSHNLWHAMIQSSLCSWQPFYELNPHEVDEYLKVFTATQKHASSTTDWNITPAEKEELIAECRGNLKRLQHALLWLTRIPLAQRLDLRRARNVQMDLLRSREVQLQTNIKNWCGSRHQCLDSSVLPLVEQDVQDDDVKTISTPAQVLHELLSTHRKQLPTPKRRAMASVLMRHVKGQNPWAVCLAFARLALLEFRQLKGLSPVVAVAESVDAPIVLLNPNVARVLALDANDSEIQRRMYKEYDLERLTGRRVKHPLNIRKASLCTLQWMRTQSDRLHTADLVLHLFQAYSSLESRNQRDPPPPPLPDGVEEDGEVEKVLADHVRESNARKMTVQRGARISDRQRQHGEHVLSQRHDRLVEQLKQQDANVASVEESDSERDARLVAEWAAARPAILASLIHGPSSLTSIRPTPTPRRDAFIFDACVKLDEWASDLDVMASGDASAMDTDSDGISYERDIGQLALLGGRVCFPPRSCVELREPEWKILYKAVHARSYLDRMSTMMHGYTA